MNSISLVFENEIDELILKSIENGLTKFDNLLLSLPGIYPTEVVFAVKRLAEKHMIKTETLEQILSSSSTPLAINSKSDMPQPHPLDFTWHFSKNTRSYLLNFAHEFTNQNDIVSFLGTPSLLSSPHDIFFDRTPCLLDKKIPNFISKKVTKPIFYQCDLLFDKIPTLSSKLVIADPPWYEEYFDSFLWTASRICSIGGTLLLILPPLGTRPTIKQELEQIIQRAFDFGFRLSQIEKNVISYQTPLFERNSLYSEGITNLPDDWRKADLGIFIKEKNSLTSRPSFHQNIVWDSITVNGVDIRIRSNQNKEFLDPILNTILPNNVLNSVSRRNPIRDRIDVWTISNRVFSCKGTNILIQILNSIQQNTSEIETISKFLGRNLTEIEIQKIKKATIQINKLIESESHNE